MYESEESKKSQCPWFVIKLFGEQVSRWRWRCIQKTKDRLLAHMLRITSQISISMPFSSLSADRIIFPSPFCLKCHLSWGASSPLQECELGRLSSGPSLSFNSWGNRISMILTCSIIHKVSSGLPYVMNYQIVHPSFFLQLQVVIFPCILLESCQNNKIAGSPNKLPNTSLHSLFIPGIVFCS